MKYVVRKGVFETNSSSTHSVQIIKAGSEIKTTGSAKVTLLKSSDDKYVFLMGIMDELCREQESAADMYDKEEIKRQAAELSLVKRYLEEYYKTHFNKTDEDIRSLMDAHQSGDEPICRSFFEEACLDECTCFYSFSLNFYKAIGFDTFTLTFDSTHLDTIFSKDCEIACGEHYAGCGKMSCLEQLFK